MAAGFLEEPLRALENTLTENFKKTRCGMYHLEHLVLQAAYELHLLFTELLPELFEGGAGQEQPIFFQPVNVYCGEFLDTCEKIYRGRL